MQDEAEGNTISVRALSNSFSEKIKGARNLFITRFFDDTMRKIFKNKWLDYKINTAIKRANKAINRLEK